VEVELMGKTLRIDKILANMGHGTRSEIKKMIKAGAVQIDGVTVKDGGQHVDPDGQRIQVDGETVEYREFIYLMLNKPQGVVSATEDLRERTVIDLLPDAYRVFQPFPVGRLDKDTEGLLLLTNDGKLAHNLLSPRKHVDKTYYAEVEGIVDGADIEAFKKGVTLDDGYFTLPAELRILDIAPGAEAAVSPKPIAKILLTITEGKFHQVKRMFQAVGKKVVFLKRISMGPLRLDEQLKTGQFRELTPEELAELQRHA
jgi:16S rRNA pseudouridine516 synthase